MLFSLILVGGIIGVAQGAPGINAERALPPGHPIIDNKFLSENGLATGYTIKTNIYPTGFSIPSEPMTALPSGYSVGPSAVYGPDGKTVSAFPSDAVAQVVAVTTATTSNPGAPTTTPSAAFRVSYASSLLVGVAAAAAIIMLA